MTARTSADVGARDRVFAEVGSDLGTAVALIKMSPGPVIWRRSGGVWLRDDMLAKRIEAGAVRLREVRRRSDIADEVSRWDQHEVDTAAKSTGRYGDAERGEVVDLTARRIERAKAGGHRSMVSDDVSVLVAADILAERARSAKAITASAVAAAVPRRGPSRREQFDRIKCRRAARARALTASAARERFLAGRFADGLAVSRGW